MANFSSRPIRPPADRISVARIGEGTLLVRVKGLGSMNNALPLAEFAESEADLIRFAVDLSECEGMDSTFMGTIVGIAQSVREKPGGWVCLLNVSDANRELLEIVGADRFFVFDPRVNVEQNLRMQALPSLDMNPERRIALVRQAHENLVEIKARNEQQFGAFLRSLTEELDRKASESSIFDVDAVEPEAPDAP